MSVLKNETGYGLWIAIRSEKHVSKEIRSFIYSSWQKMLHGWVWLWYESKQPSKDLEGAMIKTEPTT